MPSAAQLSHGRLAAVRSLTRSPNNCNGKKGSWSNHPHCKRLLTPAEPHAMEEAPIPPVLMSGIKIDWPRRGGVFAGASQPASHFRMELWALRSSIGREKRRSSAQNGAGYGQYDWSGYEKARLENLQVDHRHTSLLLSNHTGKMSFSGNRRKPFIQHNLLNHRSQA
ncbi:hypothetical protein CISG_09861 [Coccidioides immitis RMSCC 3703]|uniref:Uncharacterized protein n=1 Tax=Coccidioides immitis RMSCC 3703 TaxID=454286 RepID=A0A0J8QKG5_COCIT|nr:hypothetical protein CISG_09861 [Coccidioides immitis RMSCC 3703]